MISPESCGCSAQQKAVGTGIHPPVSMSYDGEITFVASDKIVGLDKHQGWTI